MTNRPARWILPEPVDTQHVTALSAELGMSYDISRLLALRGYHHADDAKQFLRPRLDQLHNAALLYSVDVALERLVRAIRNREPVLVHGDYDVDGMCSTAILTRTIRGLGGVAIPFIPNRLTDGYDLTNAGVEAAVAAKARVVITCDCGTSALAPVAELNRLGIDVIISDHHLPGGPLPEAMAILNPKRPECAYPDKDLAAVGVVFKLALALANAMGTPDAFVWKMLDLVALATVADIAALRGENRIFVRYGLKMMAQTENVGLRALINAAGLRDKALTAGRIGYILAPRLNAVGRLASAMRGVELLLTDSVSDANEIARELEELNRRRQDLDHATLQEARALVQAMPLDDTYGIVLGREGWHPGVIGIVASRLVEEFCRPTVLVAIDGGVGKGSGRSISVFDLHGALGECRNLFVRYGGHRAAAGVTIEPEQLPAFAERFNDVARERLTHDDFIPEVRVDAELELASVGDELEKVLKHFEPFGVGNPAPVFAARNVTVAGPPRVIGRDGLKLRLRTPHGELDAIGWGMSHRAERIAPGASIDIAFRLEREEFRGSSSLQARLADLVIH